jgi:hypothetical protein
MHKGPLRLRELTKLRGAQRNPTIAHRWP